MRNGSLYGTLLQQCVHRFKSQNYAVGQNMFLTVLRLFLVCSECNLVLNRVFVPALIIHYNKPVDVHLSGASFKQTSWEEDNGARLISSMLQAHGYSIN